MFLNESCKHAMNINEFVDSMKFYAGDLEEFGKVGYVNGITNMIIKQLKLIDVTKRPIHCTDVKRYVLYVKHENTWNRDTDDNTVIKHMINNVSCKNIRLIPEWKNNHPDCVYSESNTSDAYQQIVIETMGGCGKLNTRDSENKIIKNIAREIII